MAAWAHLIPCPWDAFFSLDYLVAMARLDDHGSLSPVGGTRVAATWRWVERRLPETMLVPLLYSGNQPQCLSGKSKSLSITTSYIDAAPSQFVPPYDSTSIYGRRLNPRVAILDLLKQVRTQSVSAWHL